MSMQRYRPYPLRSYARRLLTVGNALNAGRALGRAFNTWRSRKKPKRMSSSNSKDSPQIYGGSATRPYKRQYRRRRRPAKVRRRARRYYKKFQKALRKVSGVAFQKAVMNGFVTNSNTGVGQKYIATHLFSYNSGTGSGVETGVRDLYRVRTSMTNAFSADDVSNTTKFMIEYGIIDYTLVNQGSIPIEIDVYHITYGDNVEYSNLEAFFNGQDLRQQSLTSTATDKITLAMRGATLFDLPVTISNGYINILSKEKLFLNAKESTNFQYKMKKPFSITFSEMDVDNTYFAKKNLTHTWLFVYKPVVGLGTESALTVGSTRTYGWRVDGQNQPGTAALAE